MDQKYRDAVQLIKTAILQSQYEAAKSANEKQLMLYFGIGKYISLNSRNGFWGQGAIDTISEQLTRELPGLRGFSSRNLRNMRVFYEEWSTLDTSNNENYNLAEASAKSSYGFDVQIWQTVLPNLNIKTITTFGRSFCQIIVFVIRCI
ncbi:MAG: DUF1016 N-terminal domain-containing protein [Pseudobutyrivibrio sp.]|nr:DUF1016 N-terminal domain-containing protein [Pseudobutyrivibrio sp.]